MARTTKSTAALMVRLPKSGPPLSAEDGFVSIRIDGRRDTWMLFPISELCSGGGVRRIHDQALGPRDLTRAEHRGRRYAFVVRGRCDLDDVYALCWRPYAGLMSLRSAIGHAMGIDVGDGGADLTDRGAA